MGYLIYEKSSGKILSLREVPSQTAETILDHIYGTAPAALGVLEHWGDYPTGQKISAGQLVADPDYAPSTLA